MIDTKLRIRPAVAALLAVGLLSWSTGAAAQAAPEEIYGGPKLTSDARADHAFKLQAEGLKFAQDNAWDKARDKLLDAWKYGEFPNVAFQLAIVYDKLNEPELAREQLNKFLSLTEPSNGNYAAAMTLHAKLRKSEAPAPTPASSPIARDTPRSKAPVAPVVLAAGGAAMLIAAVTTGLLANAADGELGRNCPQNQCDPKLKVVADRGRTLKLVTNTLLITGGAALGTAAVWWMSVACSSPDGCSAAFTGRF